MTERLLVALALVALVVAIALIVRARARRQAASLVDSPVPADLRARFETARPRIVYFYGPHCATCARQARDLDGLGADCEIVRLDATRERAIADALRIATVPATAIVDSAGRVRALNLGYRPRATLTDQLAHVV